MTRKEQILDAASRILIEQGHSELSMRKLADVLGIRAPSLYKHVSGKDEVIAGLQERALRSLGQALSRAQPGVRSLGEAYRGWALANPAEYNLFTRVPLHRDLLAPGAEEAAAEPVLAAVAGDQDRARALWALAHGLVDLELAGRFPPEADIDAAWRTAVELFEQSQPTPANNS